MEAGFIGIGRSAGRGAADSGGEDESAGGATRTLWAASAVPPEVSAILQRSCQDCHTNRTTWPWYSHVAPVSWVVVSDVNGARQHMNLDEWGAYDLEKKQSRLTKICEELKSGDMPDSKYTLIHRGARLTDQQRSTLCDWAEATRKALVNTITNH